MTGTAAGRIALASLAIFAAAAAAAAQEWTDQELRERFRSQMDTFRELDAGAGGALGPPRGLVLVPRADGSGSAAAAPEAGDAAPLTLDAAQEPGYVALPQADQVYVRVTFGFDSAALAETQKPALRQLCRAMDEEGVRLFRIIGHTDAAGGDAYNQQLSVLRAEEVARFFVEDCGIAPARLEAIGVGKRHPFDAADPYAAENRRVEFQAIS